MNPKKTKSIQYPFTQKTPFGSVNIYRQVNGRTRYYVTWCDVGGRRRASFTDETAAHQRAEEIIEDFSKGVSFRNNITGVQAIRLSEYERVLSERGASLDDAVRHYVGHLESRHKERRDAMDAVTEYLNSFEDRTVKNRNYTTVKSVCMQFARAFGKKLDAITVKELTTYLRGVSQSGRTRYNHLNALKTFFKWAQRWGYLPAGEREIEKVEGFRKGMSKIEVFTPEEIRKLLDAADEAMRPALAIGAFAGVRTAEIGRLTWEDIRLDEGIIMLDSRVTKTKRRRMPLISDNLAAWLKSYRGTKKGKIRFADTKFQRDRAELCEKTGVTWKDNGLRKSYISYRMAQPDADSAKVAKQCGNSSDMVEECYKGLVTPSAASEWFSVYPPDIGHNS